MCECACIRINSVIFYVIILSWINNKFDFIWGLWLWLWWWWWWWLCWLWIWMVQKIWLAKLFNWCEVNFICVKKGDICSQNWDSIWMIWKMNWHKNGDNYLAKISLSSCSDTNWPKLATKRVEHGAFAANGGFGCCAPVEPTGLAKAGLGKKWPGGNPADTCIDCGCIADGCCRVIWFWNERKT